MYVKQLGKTFICSKKVMNFAKSRIDQKPLEMIEKM
jgi:hypothetical protein